MVFNVNTLRLFMFSGTAQGDIERGRRIHVSSRLDTIPLTFKPLSNGFNLKNMAIR